MIHIFENLINVRNKIGKINKIFEMMEHFKTDGSPEGNRSLVCQIFDQLLNEFGCTSFFNWSNIWISNNSFLSDQKMTYQFLKYSSFSNILVILQMLFLTLYQFVKI